MNLDIWAFVRIMVALEEQAHKKKPQSPDLALYNHWEQEWQEVDQQLTELSQSDFEAYSDMMMSTQITLDLPQEHRGTFHTILKALIQRMQAKRSASQDPDFKKDLAFEIQGLKTVASYLAPSS